MAKLPDLFVSLKEKAGVDPSFIPSAFRQIEQWVKTVTISTAATFYASLTGAGETVTPGDLTQAGGFTVNSTSQISLNDNTATSGIGVVENGNAPIQITANGTGGVNLLDAGAAHTPAPIQIISRRNDILIEAGFTGATQPGPLVGLTHGGISSSGVTIDTTNSNGGIQLHSDTSGQTYKADTASILVSADETNGTGVFGVNSGIIQCSGTNLGSPTPKLGFFGSGPIAKPTVTGSRGGNAALASALTALANLGLIINNSVP